MRSTWIKFMKDKRKVIAFVVVFALVGVATLVISKAATPTVLLEGENGIENGPLATRKDSTASNGEYLTFGQNDALQLSSAGAALYFQLFNNTPDWLTNSYPLIGKPRLVITRHQNSDAKEQFAVEKIHQTGALAYRYVQYFWFPDNRMDPDTDIVISDHMDWVYCRQGDTPLFGVRFEGNVSYFLDLNERAAQQNMVAFYDKVMNTWGYDGVFVDIGRGARSGRANISPPDPPPDLLIPGDPSTCTEDPIVPGRSFADSYIETITQAKIIGLKTILNYDRAYVPRKKLPADWYDYLDWTLDESVNNINCDNDKCWQEKCERGDKCWKEIYESNQDAELDGQGKTIQLIKEDIKDANGNPSTDKNDVYFRSSRARLFSSPIAVNSLNPRLYPELTSAILSGAFVAGPFSSTCNNISAGECLWGRRYSSGLVLVNNTDQEKTVNRLGLGTQSCKIIKDLYTNQTLNDGRCVTFLTEIIPARQGRIYTYK